MAKRFFYVCAGLLLLAATYHLGTKNAGAASGMVAPSEVAVASGILPHGGTIPLPVYADGTPATEAECQWSVSPMQEQLAATNQVNYLCFTSSSVLGSPGVRGRVVNVFIADGFTNQPANIGLGNALYGSANYFIIATRGAGAATSAKAQSFGALKAKYR